MRLGFDKLRPLLSSCPHQSRFSPPITASQFGIGKTSTSDARASQRFWPLVPLVPREGVAQLF